MRIQHNISAMNAKRNLNKNTGSLKKNLEKLSSGYRINRSADDAAGLAISEKMRMSIAGFEQAENNIQDGISLVQTADGAMQEIHDMLTRMTTLAAQAANGTLSNEDRQKIQSEVDEILEEIARIKDTTKFNGIPLLQGEEGAIATPPVIEGGMPAWVGMPADDHLAGEYVTTHNYTYTEIDPDTGAAITKTGIAKIPHEAAVIDFSQFDISDTQATGKGLQSLLEPDTGFYSTCCTCDNHYSIQFTDDSSKEGVSRSGSHYIFTIDISGVNSAEDLVAAIVAGTNNGIPNGHYTEIVADPTDPKKLIVFDGRSNISKNDLIAYNNDPATNPDYDPSDPATHMPTDFEWDDQSWRPYTQYYSTTANSTRGKFGAGVAHAAGTATAGDIILQIGDMVEEGNQMGIDLPDMALSKIGIYSLSVKTIPSAQSALNKIMSGVNYVSGERGRMGAYQNRLEHTYNNIGNTIENLAHAESQIRDVDIATEMMAYTKNNILIQSAQAMLAQSNQVPQGVLQLMR